jgi:Uma2 family endonuclease
MSAPPKSETTERFFATREEYLCFEETSPEKYDYVMGEVLARAGGSDEHNSIEGNVIGELRTILEKTTCRPFTSNTKIWIPQRNSFFYPDAAIACGEFDIDKKNGILHNPTVIFEILSDSTEIFDRGRKFDFYRTLPSLQEYVLMSQAAYRVECFLIMDKNSWHTTLFEGIDNEVLIRSLDLKIQMKELYRYVEL